MNNISNRDKIAARLDALIDELTALADPNASDGVIDPASVRDLNSARYMVTLARTSAYRSQLALEPGDLVGRRHHGNMTFRGWVKGERDVASIAGPTGTRWVSATELVALPVTEIARYVEICSSTNQPYLALGHGHAVARAEEIAGWACQVERLTASFIP